MWYGCVPIRTAFKKMYHRVVVASLFFFELEFVVEKNSFLSHVEHDAIVNRIIRKYKQKHGNVYYFFNEQLFNGELIVRMSVKIENNWKVNLKFYFPL